MSFRIRRTGLSATAVLAIAALGLTVIGCGRSASSDQGGNAAPSSSAASASASSSAPAVGEIGSLKNICGPGTAKGASARGLTATTIKIGVMSDPGAAAAPGIEQEFFDVADSFSKWCNAAGGINGRKIVVDKRDAKLFNVAQEMIGACQSDFMLVGGGNALDDAGVKTRLGCGLGQIAAYTVSTAAATAGLQVKPSPSIASQIPIGPVRLLAEAYPDSKTKGIALGSATLASLTEASKKNKQAVEELGIKVNTLQIKPVLVDNFRPYMEQLKSNGTVGLYEVSGQDITPEVQAIKNIGWNPDWLLYSYQFYTAQSVQAAKALGTFPNIYIGLNQVPFELSSVPVVKQIKAQLLDAVKNPGFTQLTAESYSAWMLWAKAATACGDNLTQACILAKAGSETAWTAGGLTPPTSTSPDAKQISNCTLLVRLTTNGWVYDKKVTNPNSGLFNCDPDNTQVVNPNPG
ncbi:MAG TPA: ABC transporter substrate-binding protein [Frankiaceae bacterium]|jgi:ABC-type branched-subunit amino acid transport system substrate-binding protein|nr:ABC transporter substrate-binding protein [Frankiaceae bacterium]